LREYYGFLEFLELLKSHPRSSLIACHCLMFIIKHLFLFQKHEQLKFLLLCVLWGISPQQKNPRGLSPGERTSYFKMFLHSHKKTIVYLWVLLRLSGEHLGAHTLRLPLLPQENLTLPSLPFSNKFALQIVETFVSMNLVWMPKI